MRRDSFFAILSANIISCACLSSCTGSISWDRSYNLRQWEKVRIAAESALLAGDYRRAEELLKMAVIFARNLGASDFRVGATLSLLGDAIRREGKLNDARSVYEQALSSLHKSLALSHTQLDRRLLQQDIAQVKVHLGDICFKGGDLASAERYYSEAASFYKGGQEGTSSHFLAEYSGRALLGLGMLRARQGNIKAAAQTYKAALEAAVATHYSLRLEHHLQMLYTASRQEGATAAGLEAIPAGDRFQDFILVAREAVAAKDYVTAERNYAAAVELGKKLGLDAAKMAAAYDGLARNQEWQSKLEQAAQNYRKSLEQRDKINPAGDEDTEFLLIQLSKLSHSLQDEKAAYGYLSRLLKLRRASSGENSPEVADTLARLAEANLARGDRPAARQNALRSWSLLKKSRGKESRVAATFDTLARVFLGMGKYEESRSANDQIINYCRNQTRQPVICALAQLRRAAIHVQEGKAVDGASRSNGDEADRKIALPDAAAWLRLFKRMNAEAPFLAAQGQIKAGKYMAEWSLKLVNSQDASNPDFRTAKIKALINLSTIERKMGNNERADQLTSEAEQLQSNRQ